MLNIGSWSAKQSSVAHSGASLLAQSLNIKRCVSRPRQDLPPHVSYWLRWDFWQWLFYEAVSSMPCQSLHDKFSLSRDLLTRSDPEAHLDLSSISQPEWLLSYLW